MPRRARAFPPEQALDHPRGGRARRRRRIPTRRCGSRCPMMNRHGLIAGATGTGKTKDAPADRRAALGRGVPVFLADVKGDVSGVAAPGEASPRVTQRAAETGYAWNPTGYPVEFLSLTGAHGAQLRATVSSFGPLLLAKVLGLNETQSCVLAMVFKYCRRPRASAARLRRSARRAPAPDRRRRGRAQGLRRHVQSRRSACSCARWSSSSSRAPARSSASPSSTSHDLLQVAPRRPRRGERARARRTCRTSPRSTRPS